jgi:hypothetical protein
MPFTEIGMDESGSEYGQVTGYFVRITSFLWAGLA